MGYNHLQINLLVQQTLLLLMKNITLNLRAHNISRVSKIFKTLIKF
jgi:hypothetical protein